MSFPRHTGARKNSPNGADWSGLMATKTNGITRADALQLAIDLMEDEWGGTEGDWPEAVAVLRKMHASITKPRKATVSKARKANEALAAKVRDLISANGDGVSAKDVVNFGIAEITSTQKATAVLRVAVELGYLTKNVEGKAITYALA